MRIRAYVLAGGLSSRMGEDKAMLLLRGKTLLARVVETLRGVDALRPDEGQTIVTVVGERASLEGADRMIADRYPQCGPLGGIEAALADLEGGETADWAFFLPVDMPLLPGPVIDQLLGGWITGDALVNYAVVDGIPQPLVSLVHRTVHPAVREALHARRFKVAPLLASAADAQGSSNEGRIAGGAGTPAALIAGLLGTNLDTDLKVQERQTIWFSNLNTREDFARAETFLTEEGLGS